MPSRSRRRCASLEASGLRVVIAQSKTLAPPAGRRIVKLELTGLDRPGIVRELSRHLAQRGVSIDDLHTEIVRNDSARRVISSRCKALLVVPESLSNEALRNAPSRRSRAK